MHCSRTHSFVFAYVSGEKCPCRRLVPPPNRVGAPQWEILDPQLLSKVYFVLFPVISNRRQNTHTIWTSCGFDTYSKRYNVRSVEPNDRRRLNVTRNVLSNVQKHPRKIPRHALGKALQQTGCDVTFNHGSIRRGLEYCSLLVIVHAYVSSGGSPILKINC